jgi:hypothetical protein
MLLPSLLYKAADVRNDGVTRVCVGDDAVLHVDHEECRVRPVLEGGHSSNLPACGRHWPWDAKPRNRVEVVATSSPPGDRARIVPAGSALSRASGKEMKPPWQVRSPPAPALVTTVRRQWKSTLVKGRSADKLGVAPGLAVGVGTDAGEVIVVGVDVCAWPGPGFDSLHPIRRIPNNATDRLTIDRSNDRRARAVMPD